MKTLRVEHKILLSIIAFLILAVIGNMAVNLYAIKTLNKEVKEINEIIKKEPINFVGSQVYNIKDGKITLEDKEIASNFKGDGKVFYEEDGTITIILTRFEKCAIKILDNEDASITNRKCPNYQILQGAKVKVSENTNLYEIKSTGDFIYKGPDSDNYIVYNDEYWRVVSFTKEGIKIVYDYSMGKVKFDDITTYLNNDYGVILPSVKDATFNVGASKEDKIKPIIKNESQDTITTKVSTLSLSDYYNSKDCECTRKSKIKKGQIKCVGRSYVNDSDFWLSTPYDSENAWYVDKSGTMKIASKNEEKNIRPVIILDKRYKVIDGEGTKENPFKLTILSE